MFQRISALLLLALLVFHAHAVFGHFLSSGSLTWSGLSAVLSRPSIKAAELAFFALATIHAMNGLWDTVVFFFADRPRQRFCGAVIIASGVLFLAAVSYFIITV
jgi:succinate dehydrogenase hydrophobic anchor subunit